MKKIVKKLVTYLVKKNQFLRTNLRKLKNIRIKRYYKKCCKQNVVNENIIVFESYMGRQYACSPRAIYEEMLKDDRFKDFEFVWFFKEIEKYNQNEKLKKAKLVNYNSKQYFEYYSKAKYMITNSRVSEIVEKREGQEYIQCWHGTPLKRLGYDIELEGGNAMNSLMDMRQKYKEDAVRFSYLLSPSEFTSEKLATAFNLKENNPNAEIVEKGYPRNDFLFNYTEEDKNIIKKSLGIEYSTKKIILYAPTWRDNQHTSGVGYTYELGIDFDKLRAELQEDFIILFRPHYFVANSFNFEKYKGFIYNVANVDDVNDVYVLADILITDYSSVFFDYANLKRPIIFYMYDLANYKDQIRGFYLELNDLPGEIVEKELDLIKEIKEKSVNFNYDEKYKRFNQKFNYLDDGNSSKRVIETCIMQKV